MRFAAAIALVLAAAVGCSHGSSNASDSKAPFTHSAPSAAPVYPGAGALSGSAYSTSDSFDTVYAFYDKNLPPGSERSHITAPQERAVFLVGSGNDQLSVTVTKSPTCCRTLIVFALVKA
jgi:ABC-type oligopeptide transport system substrate-binding subunit